jgi:hypothetical protein
MQQENSIGLSELIQKVKQELLINDLKSGEAPFLSVDEVSLELQVTIQKEGDAGIKIHIIQIGGKVSRDDVQTIKVTLTPLLSKEERLKQFERQYPGGIAAAVAAVAEVSVKATVKGSSKESQRKTFEG